MTPAQADRFWAKVAENGDCWEWQGANDGRGYGQFRFDDRTRRAHRVAYEQMVGEIPDGLQLDHLCRNRSCVNPYHLDPVPNIVNQRRGLSGAHNRAKTHCSNGHELAGDNLRLSHEGTRRHCRTCDRMHAARSSSRRRAAA